MVVRSAYPDLFIPNVDFPQLFLHNVSKYSGNKAALVSASDGRTYTYKEMITAIQNCKSFLLRKGITKNDVVAMCCPNIPEYVICLVAVAACGAVSTTCNPLSTHYEISQQFQDSKPKLVFTVVHLSKKLEQVCKHCDWVKDVVFIGESKHCVSFKQQDGLQENMAQDHNPSIDPFVDLMLLPYSSGTTGLPKGVKITHRNVTSSVIISRINWKLLLHDVEYLVLPIFHIYGLLRSLSAVNQGATLVLDTRFSLERMATAVEKYKVTVIPLVPPMLLSISKDNVESRYDMSSVRCIIVGAAPIPPELLQFVTKKLNCQSIQAWGMTETTGVSVIANDITWGISQSSTGKVCPMNLVKICDVETGRELGPYDHGEVMVKGPNVTIGYYNNPEATARLFDQDGFLHTGDIGYFDDLEQIYVIDRVKELIKYKGFQVAPAEIEHALMSHSKVADAAVIGVPDPEAGELPKAFIVKKDLTLSKSEIETYLREKLSKYKQLHGGIEFVNQIPKSASGKILRRLLRRKIPANKL